MKFALSLLVLSVLALTETSFERYPVSEANLFHGAIQPGDKLIHRAYFQESGIPDRVQTKDYSYSTTNGTLISAVSVTESNYPMHALPSIVAGGKGYNHTTIRIQTAKGLGFDYQIDIWGRMK